MFKKLIKSINNFLTGKARTQYLRDVEMEYVRLLKLINHATTLGQLIQVKTLIEKFEPTVPYSQDLELVNEKRARLQKVWKMRYEKWKSHWAR